MFTGALTACGSSKEKKKEKAIKTKTGVSTKDTGKVDEDMTSLDVVRAMGNGINLGNTMEAYGHGSMSPDSDPESFETKWGQPVTTQEMIDGMKALGFDSLRIPVAWTNAMDYESGDYTINSAYLDRVEEIANYALNNDMYVVINDHWDGGWWGMFGSASEETRSKAMDMYVSMWQQICERFKDYSDKVIFESANEELGSRLNDTDIASDSGSLSQDECYEKTNEINQKFVDTVRATGGNNAKRFLLIAGFNTDIAMTCDDRFKMPEDSAEQKLLLSVHYYTPWDYCGVESVNHWGSVTDYQEQNKLFQKLSKFSEQGYGVIIGEYAVALKNGEVKNDTDKFIANVLANCDLYDYCPMLWDCSSLYKRVDCEMPDKTIAQLFKSNAYENEVGK
ncbi:MAG: glycoside hydrolase family 5 protein, partial [Ruminococcus sp.]|nr:glycoside hydrolase family 5 protein [Ruminococcus sp.]